MWAFSFDTQRSDQLELSRSREHALRCPEKADELAPGDCRSVQRILSWNGHFAEGPRGPQTVRLRHLTTLSGSRIWNSGRSVVEDLRDPVNDCIPQR